MGGKNKQSQRTKNNVRPSSSGRSAELLSNSLRADGGTVLAGGKALPALFPSLAAAALDCALAPEFALCFKKLNKKDPITRVKALQELTELVGNGKVEDAAAALPAWAPAYRALAADVDRKVREHAQICHGAFVSACGRRVAPQLRALLPAWLQSQHDDHAPAQAAARRTLQSTFPESRLPEVVAFCRAEVAAHALAALLAPANASPPAPAPSRVESEEQREHLQISAQRGALQTLRALAATLPAEHGAWLAATLQPLLQSAAFWQLRTHPEPHLRAAWYAALGQVWARAGPHLPPALSQKALRLVLGAREPAAPAAPHYWAALLHLAHCSPEWYEWLDKKELLAKRIMDLLENGGWGEARSLGDALLPLLARLPPALRALAFYRDLFAASLRGLMTKNVISSKSERQWWITSLAECLRYLSIQSEEFVVEAATGAHRGWLAAVTAHRDPQVRANLVRHSATNMTSLVKYWLKLSKKNGEKYDQLVRNFWQNVGSTTMAQIDKASTEPEEVTGLIECHTLLFHTLKVSFLQELKKQQSIKFEGDAKDEESAVTEQAEQKSDTVDTERYVHNLNDVVWKVCGGYFEFASEKQMANVVFGPLVTLLVEFDSEELWAAVARRLGAECARSLYEGVLSGWLRGDTMRCRPLVEVVFLLMKHLAEPEQDALFDSFKQFPPSVVEWCARAALAHPHRSRPAARRWLRGALVRDTVLAACRRALTADDDAARRLLLSCLAQDDDGELTVSEACLWRVVELVSGQPWQRGAAVTSPAGEGSAAVTSQEGEGNAAVTPPEGEGSAAVTSQEGEGSAAVTSREGGEARARVALAAALWAALPAHAPPEVQLQLAGSLFRLNLYVRRGDPALPADSWDEARGCWQELPPAAARLFLPEAAALVGRRLRQQSDTLDIAEIEHIASLCPYLLRQCDAGQPTDVTEVVALTERLFALLPRGADAASAGAASAEACALKYDCVTGNLNCLFDDDNDHIKNVIDDSANVDAEDLTKETALSYLNNLLFRAIYLRTILLRKPEEEDEDSTEKAKCWCDTLFKDKYIVEEFTGVLYDYCVLGSLHEGYAYWPHYSLIQQARQKLIGLLEDVVVETGAEARGTIKSALSETAATVGYYWASARSWYERETARTVVHSQIYATKAEGEDVTNVEDIVTGNGFFHMMQVENKNSSEPGEALRTSYLIMLRSLHVAYGAQRDVIDERFLRDAAAAQRDCGADVLVNLYYRHKHILLGDRGARAAPWAQAAAAAAAARYLAALAAARGWLAPAHHWDFLAIALCALLDSLERTRDAWGAAKVAMLAHATFALYGAVARFVGAVRAQCEVRAPPAHVAALPREWADVFAPHAARCLARCALGVLESAGTRIASTHACYIAALSAALSELRWARAPPPGVPALERVARACGDAMRAPRAHHALLYFAHKLLLDIADALVLEDAEKLAAWEARAAAAADEESAARSKPQLALAYLQPALAALEAAVDSLLQPYRIGEDTCALEPHTGEYNAALGYLLLSDAFHCGLCTRQRQDRALHYIEILRENRMAELLLTAALRLLPRKLMAALADSGAGSVPDHHLHLDWFSSVRTFDVFKAPQSEDIGALACRGAYGALAGAGRAAARAWWGAAAPRPARLAHRLVRLCVAPPLVRAQLQDLNARKHQLQNAQISIAWSSREATCSYRVEETPLQVTVAFSEAHPLQPPRVTAPHRAAPPHAAHWLQLYLAYQNGSLVKAFQMWMHAVSARLERAPQCYICYCRLHPASGRLPSAPCHQCGNKFHTQCLRKWFSTSSKSNCPLCRGTF